MTDSGTQRVDGQSMKAIWFRFLTPMNSVHQSRHNDPIYINVADVDPGLVQWLYIASVIAVLAAAAVTARVRNEDWRAPSIQAAVFLAAWLLVSPESRRAHFMILMLPYGIVGFSLLRPMFTAGSRLALGGIALAAMLAISVPSRSLVGRKIANLTDAYANMGFATLVLGAVLILMLRALASDCQSDPEKTPGSAAPTP